MQDLRNKLFYRMRYERVCRISIRIFWAVLILAAVAVIVRVLCA